MTPEVRSAGLCRHVRDGFTRPSALSEMTSNAAAA
jgi:hypothetical protein